MSWLIVTNGITAILFATLPLEDCELAAKRINDDYHYSEITAYCQEIDNVSSS